MTLIAIPGPWDALGCPGYSDASTQHFSVSGWEIWDFLDGRVGQNPVKPDFFTHHIDVLSMYVD
jgi:hypothetical protein